MPADGGDKTECKTHLELNSCGEDGSSGLHAPHAAFVFCESKECAEQICPRDGRYRDRDRSMLKTIAICPEW